MVDLQFNWEAAWPDTSLFGDELINNTDLFNTTKSNFKGKQAVLGLPDLEWFDEKVDLSVLNNPNNLLDHQNETQALMEDDSAFLLGLLGDSFDPSYLSSDIFKNGDIDFSKEFDIQELVAEPTSSEVLDSHLASPQCELLQVNSPSFTQVSSPASPYSDISDASEESSCAILHSTESSSFTSDFSNKDSEASRVRVSVCDTVKTPTNSEPVLSIEELSESVRKRKFVSDGESKPKIVKVMFPDDVAAPRARTHKKPKDSRERKKIQNKEAAARYRIKKRMEEKIIADEVQMLESTQEELQEQHDKLQMEIKYLKSFMCEMLTKKGIMK